MDNILSDESYNLWMLVFQTRNAMSRPRSKELAKYDLSIRKSAILFIIQAIQAIGAKTTPAEIARWLVIEPHTTSENLSRMERDGLIVKTKDLNKKNRIQVSLTAKGRKVYQKSSKRVSIHEIMSYLSDEEHKQLKAILLKLRNVSQKTMGVKYELPYPE